MQFDRLEQLADLRGVVLGVERRDGRGAGRHADGFAPVAPLAEELGVGFLDVRAVLEHGHAEVDGGGRGVDGPAIALLPQQRQVAAVVDVRVRQDDRVQRARGKLLGRKRKMRVDVGCLLATALIEAAVQQHVLPRAFDVVGRPGDGFGPHPRNANELPCALLYCQLVVSACALPAYAHDPCADKGSVFTASFMRLAWLCLEEPSLSRSSLFQVHRLALRNELLCDRLDRVR